MCLPGAAPSACYRNTGNNHTQIPYYYYAYARPSAFLIKRFHSQCYVVAAAQVGRHSPKRASYGHAMCVDPWGTVVAEAGLSFYAKKAFVVAACCSTSNCSRVMVAFAFIEFSFKPISSTLHPVILFRRIPSLGASGGEHAEIIYADVDLRIVQRVRHDMPVISHEQTAAYRL